MTAERSAPRISNEARRARLVRRHHLGRSASGVVEAVRDVVAFHSSDPLTPYLGVRARVPGFVHADLDQALYEDRTLLRLHAMRRTLFVVPEDEVAFLLGSVGLDLARKERRRVERWVRAEVDAADSERETSDDVRPSSALPRSGDKVSSWLAALEVRVLEELSGGEELLTGELADRIPELDARITLGSGKWTARASLASRLLFLMAMEGRIVRTRPAGSWRSSQYRWVSMARWLGRKGPEAQVDLEPSRDLLGALSPQHASAELLRRYLARFGPATLEDIRWWTGWTASRTRAAIDAVEAAAVDLEGGAEGLVLPDDLEPVGELEPGSGPAGRGAKAVAFLPALDPTVMGWKTRDWYVGSHADRLFDRNGNAGATVWVGGRIVGGWGLSPHGQVTYRLLEDVAADAEVGVAEEAGRLAGWLEGENITPRFRTPLEKELGR